MMSNFNNKSITNKGFELLSAAMAGGRLEFTRIVMGNGTYSGDIGMIESLVSQKQSLDIKSITRKGSQVILSTTLLQSAITEDFYWKEIGIYAKGADNVEVLYMYGSATDTSFISKDMLNEKMINVGVLVSNAQNITATIDGSLVYLSRADLEEHNNDETAHKSLRSWVQGLFDSLKLTWDSITGKPETFPPSGHDHDDRYYTESEINTLLNAKANSSHTHTKSQITDFPTSLPASDVYSWAKQPTKPSYSAGEVGAIPTTASCNKNWNWAGQGGQPSWLWGGNDAANMYVYNPANFRVANANTLKDRDLCVEVDNLKSSVVNGKQSVANAINGKLGTSLSNQTSFADMAYYINSISVFKQENLVSTSSNYVYMQNCRVIAFARQGGSSCILYFANGATSIGATVYRCAWSDGSFSSYRTTFNLTSSKEISDITVGFVVFDSPVSFNVKTRTSEGVIKIF